MGALQGDAFVTAFRQLTGPPPKQPSGKELIDPAMQRFDDWFRDGYTTQSLDLLLSSKKVPLYVTPYYPDPPYKLNSTVQLVGGLFLFSFSSHFQASAQQIQYEPSCTTLSDAAQACFS
jgi:hypothetical protein